MAEYWGTAEPVIVEKWYNAEGAQVMKVKCPDSLHADFKYYLNGRAVIAPAKGMLVMYNIVPGKRNPDGSFEEAKYIHIATGEEWNAERDIRLIRG